MSPSDAVPFYVTPRIAVLLVALIGGCLAGLFPFLALLWLPEGKIIIAGRNTNASGWIYRDDNPSEYWTFFSVMVLVLGPFAIFLFCQAGLLLLGLIRHFVGRV